MDRPLRRAIFRMRIEARLNKRTVKSLRGGTKALLLLGCLSLIDISFETAPGIYTL
jgi:hypothetical protein